MKKHSSIFAMITAFVLITLACNGLSAAPAAPQQPGQPPQRPEQPFSQPGQPGGQPRAYRGDGLPVEGHARSALVTVQQ